MAKEEFLHFQTDGEKRAFPLSQKSKRQRNETVDVISAQLILKAHV